MAVNPVQNASDNEEQIKSIKEFFEWLKRLLSKSPFGKAVEKFGELGEKLKSNSKYGTIVQKMEQLEDEMIDLAANDEITQDTIEELTKIVMEMDGKLDALTPEKIEKMLGDIEGRVDEIIKARDEKLKELNKGKGIIEQVKYQFEKAGVKVGEDFENEFLTKARIIDIGKLYHGGNTLLVEMEGKLVQAKFNCDDPKNPSIQLSPAELKYNEVFDENGNFKNPDYQFVQMESCYGNAAHNLVSAFCRANEIVYGAISSQEKQRLADHASSKTGFLYSHIDDKVTSADGKYESKVVDGSYYLRSKETGTCLRVFTNSANAVQVDVIQNTNDLPQKGSLSSFNRFSQKLETWSVNDFDKIKNTLDLRCFTPEIMDMLMSDDMMTYFEQCHNISRESQENLFINNGLQTGLFTEKDVEKGNGIKLYGEALKKVENLENIVAKDNTFDCVSIHNTEFSTTLEINNKRDKFKVEFAKDGSPKKLFYRQQGEEGAPKEIYNFRTGTASKAHNEYVQKDPKFDEKFDKVFNYAQKALGMAGIKPNKNQDKEINSVYKPAHQKKFAELKPIDLAYNRRSTTPLELTYMSSMYGLENSLDYAYKVVRAAKLVFDKEMLPKDEFDMAYYKTREDSILKDTKGALQELGVIDANGKVICTPEDFSRKIAELATNTQLRYENVSFGVFRWDKPESKADFDKWADMNLSANSDKIDIVRENAWKTLLVDAFNTEVTKNLDKTPETVYTDMRNDYWDSMEFDDFFKRSAYKDPETIVSKNYNIDSVETLRADVDRAEMINRAAVYVLDENCSNRISEKTLDNMVFNSDGISKEDKSFVMSSLQELGIINKSGRAAMSLDTYKQFVNELAVNSVQREQFGGYTAFLSEAYGVHNKSTYTPEKLVSALDRERNEGKIASDYGLAEAFSEISRNINTAESTNNKPKESKGERDI